jgi:hypothetical protein
MIDIFGEESIWNNEHQPKCFEHQIKIAKWMVDLDNNRPVNNSPVIIDKN